MHVSSSLPPLLQPPDQPHVAQNTDCSDEPQPAIVQLVHLVCSLLVVKAGFGALRIKLILLSLFLFTHCVRRPFASWRLLGPALATRVSKVLLSVSLLPLTLLVPLLQKFIVLVLVILRKFLLFPLLKLFSELLFIFILLPSFFPRLLLSAPTFSFPLLSPIRSLLLRPSLTLEQ